MTSKVLSTAACMAIATGAALGCGGDDETTVTAPSEETGTTAAGATGSTGADDPQAQTAEDFAACMKRQGASQFSITGDYQAVSSSPVEGTQVSYYPGSDFTATLLVTVFYESAEDADQVGEEAAKTESFEPVRAGNTVTLVNNPIGSKGRQTLLDCLAEVGET